MKSVLTRFPSVLLYAIVAISIVSCRGYDRAEREKVKRVFLPEGETHEGWYFAAGQQVVIEGTVNGDAYIAGGLVEVTGKINGDLLVVGGQVDISGTVSDDIRAAGGNIQINGIVGKNISAAGGNINIGKSAVIGGNILTASGTLRVGGAVEREARAAARDMSVSGRINGDVHFSGDNLSIFKGAKVGGSLSARVKEKEHVDISEGTVLGTVDISVREMRPHQHILGFHPWFFWVKIFWTASLLVMGLALLFAFPKQLIGIGSTISQLPGKSFLWGLMGVILIPVISVLLLITIIGIPLGLLCLTVFAWVAYLTQLSLGVFLGQRLFGMEGKTRWNQFSAFAVGLLLVQALTFVPYVRPLVILAGLIFGFGAILLLLKSTVASAKAGEAISEKL